jgi:hypothetical protein
MDAMLSPVLMPPLSPALTPPSGHPSRITGGGADRWASMPAPAGYRWVFVTYLGQGVTYLGEPAVALESING